MYGVFFPGRDMMNPSLSVELRAMKSNWASLSDEQKVENVISRVRLWVTESRLTPDEVELALNIGFNALAIVRVSAEKSQEAA